MDNNPKKTFFLIFFVLYIVSDLLVTKYYLPDVKGIYHSYYNHGLRKNYTGIFWWGDRSYRVYTNSLGFKDSEIREVPKKVNQHRILFIGDSFTEGAGLPYEKTFVSMFHEKAGPFNFDVLNAGVVSYSPKLYYLKLKYLLETTDLDFDELFVFIDISDIQDEIDYSIWNPVVETRFHQLDSYLRSISITYKILRQNVLNSSDLPFLSKIKQYFNKMETHLGETENKSVDSETQAVVQSRAINVTREANQLTLIDNNRKDAEIRTKAFKIPDDFKTNHNLERPKWTYDQEIYDKWGKEGLELAGTYMDKVVSLMRKHNIKMHIVVYPWPEQIINNDLNSRQVAYWKAFSEARDVGFINLFPDFFISKADKTIQKYFIPGDVHWNKVGHELVAERLYQYRLDVK